VLDQNENLRNQHVQNLLGLCDLSLLVYFVESSHLLGPYEDVVLENLMDGTGVGVEFEL